MNVRRALGLVVFFTSLPKLIVVYLVGSCTAFSPDEGTYLHIFNSIRLGTGSRSTLVWAQTPSWMLRVFFAPAELLHHLGVSDLTSLRLAAVLLSEISILLVFLTLKKIEVRFDLYRTILFILAFSIPSVVLWSSSGLREAFLYISLAGTFFSLVSYINEKNFLKYFYLATYAISISILGFNKFYLFTVLVFSIFVSVVLIMFSKRSKSKYLPVALMTVVVFSFTPGGTSQLHIPSINFSLTNSYQYGNSQEFRKFPTLSMTLAELQKCRDKNTGGPLISFLSRNLPTINIEAPKRSKLVPLGATDVSPANFIEGQKRDVIRLSQIPTGLILFLVAPRQMGSLGVVGSYGVFESLLWVPLYLIFGYFLFKLRRLKVPLPPEAMVCIPFILSFVLFSSATEVNFGTALRHRSILLIPFLIVIYSTWSIFDFSKSRKSTSAPIE